ncbi:hypothetical protein IVA98_22740 [Bradyrhizobium sp. 160]|uniref:hypothetical protein n=1 Tax=Bradyrhizobium sp. 160 TaxID=2782634 RepID=UPI001FFA8A89|nr:hypothetical protein [Bradyrhizobium sp. 160]MCK1625929.1 hypothetical protein [Bradyrhizobium sp. 160]
MTTNPNFRPALKSLKDTRRFVDGVRLEPAVAAELEVAARHFAAHCPSTKSKAEFSSLAIRLLASLGLVATVTPSAGEPDWLSADQKKFVRHGGGQPIWVNTVEYPQDIWKYAAYDSETDSIDWVPAEFSKALRAATDRAGALISSQRVLPPTVSSYRPRDPLKDARRFSDGVRLDPVVGWQLTDRADALNVRFPSMRMSRASFIRTALPILARLGLVDLIDPRAFLPEWLSQSQKEYAASGGRSPIWMPTNVKKLCAVEFDYIGGEIRCTRPTTKRRLAPSFN